MRDDLTRWRTVAALFDEALQLPEHARPAFLDERCREDHALHAEVTLMLALDGEAERTIGETVDTFIEPILPVLQESILEASSLAPGSRLGPYRVVRLLGRGGMGNVYLGERADGTFEKQVALKLVRRGHDTDEMLARFRQERQLLAGLDHPHIARLLDGGVAADGRPYLVMEYVDGRPITEHCDAERLSLPARLALFEQVCTAVTHAHRRLVIHRDLKPSNVLVTAEGAVKLLDFGIAKLLDGPEDAALTTREGARLLTPEYAAPEQIRGEPVSTAADVYALGVLLYHLLAGARPIAVKGLGPLARERALLHDEPATPSHLVTRAAAAARGTSVPVLQRQLRGDLTTILGKALAKEPDRRYGSVEALAEDLSRYRRRLPIRARPESRFYRTGRFIARHRVGVSLGTGLAVLLLALVVTLTVSRRQITEQRDRAERELLEKEQVTEFLMSLFEGSSPEVARGEELTARNLLERGTERARYDLAAQPELQAMLLHLIGRLYLQLGDTQQALELGQHALDLYRQQLPPDALEVGAAYNLLGSVHLRTGDLEAAEGAFVRALGIRRRHLPPDDPAVIRTMLNLSMTKSFQGETEAAEALLEAFAAFGPLSEFEDRESLSFILNGIGVHHYRAGRYAEASGYFRQTLALRRALYGPSHPRITTVLNNLGVIHLEQGELEEAEAYLREALVMEQELFGAEHLNTANKLNNLASVLRGRGLPHEALRYAEAAVAVHRAHHAAHPDFADALVTLGSARQATGALAAAEEVLLEALRMYRLSFGAEHAHEGHALHNLASTAAARGDLALAEDRYRQALDVQRRLLPPGHARTVSSALALADLLDRTGRPTEARTLRRLYSAAP